MERFPNTKIEKVKSKSRGDIMLSVPTPKPSDIELIKSPATAAASQFQKTLGSIQNIKIKNRKSFSLFFKNFEENESISQEKKIENFLSNIKRKSSASIQYSSEKETTGYTNNTNNKFVGRSLSTFKYPFKKMDLEMDKESYDQLNILFKELHQKHKKCGKFCEHMKRFFQKLSTLGIGTKKFMSIPNKFIDKIPTTFC